MLHRCTQVAYRLSSCVLLPPREGKALQVHLVDRDPLAPLDLVERMALRAKLVRTVLI